MNWKEVQIRLAEEYKVPLQTVEQETNGYWSDVKKRLSRPEKVKILIVGFGKWEINQKRLFRLMSYYLQVLRKLQAGILTKAQAESLPDMARFHIPYLWRLKQKMGWHLTKTTKPGPKQTVQDLKTKLDALPKDTLPELADLD